MAARPASCETRSATTTNPRGACTADCRFLSTTCRLWEAIDTDGNGVVDEEEYFVMSRKLQALLTVDVHTNEGAVALARADWERDRRGQVCFLVACGEAQQSAMSRPCDATSAWPHSTKLTKLSL